MSYITRRVWDDGLRSSSALWHPSIARHPQALYFIYLGFTVSFGTGLAAIGTVLGPLLQIGLAVGLSVLSNLLTPTPKPEDVQGNYRQSTPVRGALYGEGLIGGAWAFGATKNGEFHKIIALASRKLTSIEEHWVDDKSVVVDGSGWVTAAPYNSKLRILTRLGETPNTYYSELETFFSEWTSSHRGDGIASLYSRQLAVKEKDLGKVFPNLFNTLYRVRAKGVVVYDPTDVAQSVDNPATWTYSDNLARVVMDYLWHVDGMKIPVSRLTTPQALAGWVEAVNDCNDAIPLKAGGTEPRYRCWCYYQYNERPGDVVKRMMAAGAARFKLTADGGLTIVVGKWRAPTVTIDDDAVIALSDVGRGRSKQQTANVVRATFTSPLHKFQTTDADIWIDEADVSERGAIETDRQFPCSPSHGQTRRLMKIEAHRAKPEWVGTFPTNLRGMEAFGEQFINFGYSPLGITGEFEIGDYSLLVQDGTLVGAQISLSSITEAAFAWDAATEEGTPPPIDEIDEVSSIPDATGFTAELVIKTVGGVSLPYARLAWDAVPSESLSVEIQAKKVSDTAWTPVGFSVGETTVDWLMTEEGEDYEFEARYSGMQSSGTWVNSTPPTLTATTDPVAPLALSSFTVTGGSLHLGHAPLAFVTVSDDHLSRIALYRAPKGVTLDKDAHYVRRLTGVPKPSTFTYTDGDNTRTNLLSNGDFASDTVWAKTGVTISGGKGNKVAGSAGFWIQTGLTIPSGGVARMALTLSARTAGNTWLRPADAALAFDTSSALATNATHLAAVSITAARDRLIIASDAASDASVDDSILYMQTASCAPQGDWDYYAIPENVSGIEGPQSGPLNVIIV